MNDYGGLAVPESFSINSDVDTVNVKDPAAVSVAEVGAAGVGDLDAEYADPDLRARFLRSYCIPGADAVSLDSKDYEENESPFGRVSSRQMALFAPVLCEVQAVILRHYYGRSIEKLLWAICYFFC